jgi:hypothetical protein
MLIKCLIYSNFLDYNLISLIVLNKFVDNQVKSSEIDICCTNFGHSIINTIYNRRTKVIGTISLVDQGDRNNFIG